MEDNLTHCVWTLMEEENAILDPARNGTVRRGILFEISSDDEDGTYPRVSDYKRYVNSLDREGTNYFLNRLTKKKNKKLLEFEGIKIKRSADWDDHAEIIFPKPIRVRLENIGKRKIIENVTKLRGRFLHDYFWSKKGRQHDVANGFEIWFDIEEYVE